MGRGLSKQQRSILAAAVALNAARNDGLPQPPEVLIDLPRGVVVQTMFGESLRRQHEVMTAGIPELTDAFVLVAFGGFVRAPVDFSTAERWRNVDHKKRVSLARAVKGLLRRDLIARAMEPRRIYWARDQRKGRDGWTVEERIAADTHDNLRPNVLRYWGRWNRYATPGYTLLPEAFAEVGETWRAIDATWMAAAFEHAEGFDAQRSWNQQRRSAS